MSERFNLGQRKSGAARRKEAADKEKKTNEVIAKTPKLTTFFTVTTETDGK